MPLSPGTCLGRHDVTSLLGEGGMGQGVVQTTRIRASGQLPDRPHGIRVPDSIENPLGQLPES